MSRAPGAVRRRPPKPSRGKGPPPARRRRWRERFGAWRDQHLYGFVSSLGRLWQRPFAGALVLLVIGVALALPLLFWLGYDNVREWSGGLREAREVSLFLRPELDVAAGREFADELEARADVAEVLLRTPQQGLDEFRSLSGFAGALELLASNPLPVVLVVSPAAADALADPALVEALRADPRVDLVQYDATWRRKLSGILQFSERLVAVMAVLLALATLLVIGNTVRMDIQARSEEVSIMQLLGASDGFVRRPFLYAGFCYGLCGALLALGMVAGVELALRAPLARLLEAWGEAPVLHGLGLGAAAALLAAGALLGWLGAFVVVTRHLARGRAQA